MGILMGLSPIPCVGLQSLCLSVEMSGGCTAAKWLDLDAVCGGEWGRSRDGCIRLGGDRLR